MTRARPWRAEHPGAVIVDRRGRWGNPFYVAADRGRWTVYEHGLMLDSWPDKRRALVDAVARFDAAVHAVEMGFPSPRDIREGLAGCDLACWCPLDQPCHADVLLEIANGGAA